MDCHQGRLIRTQIEREMLRSLGIVTCPKCHRCVAILGRRWRHD